MARWIAVAGDYFVDHYWIGEATRLSPEAPVPVVLIKETKTFPGGAGNVAAQIAALGARVDRIGDSCCKPQKHRLMAGDVQIARWDCHDKRPVVWPPEKLWCDALVIADYGKGSINDEIIAQFMCYEGPIFLDTKQDPSPYIRLNTADHLIAFPNRKEYEQYKEQYDALGECVVTKGAEGVERLHYGSVVESYPAWGDRIRCVAGCGDTVTAVYAWRYPKPDALGWANAAAAVVVAKQYTAVATRTEIEDVLEQVGFKVE